MNRFFLKETGILREEEWEKTYTKVIYLCLVIYAMQNKKEKFNALQIRDFFEITQKHS